MGRRSAAATLLWMHRVEYMHPIPNTWHSTSTNTSTISRLPCTSIAELFEQRISETARTFMPQQNEHNPQTTRLEYVSIARSNDTPAWRLVEWGVLHSFNGHMEACEEPSTDPDYFHFSAYSSHPGRSSLGFPFDSIDPSSNSGWGSAVSMYIQSSHIYSNASVSHPLVLSNPFHVPQSKLYSLCED